MDYYAVITADGDKMGELIKAEATKDPAKIKELSEKLYNFFTKENDIHSLTNEVFGGELIYAGGDDILAFVPVKSDKGTFFDYIEALNERFTKIVGESVSLSFGISVVYCTYPLRDAIKMAFDLLYEAKDNGKNSMALRVTKHSGQWMQTSMQLDTQRYENYSKMLSSLMDENEAALPHAFHHSLFRYKDAVMVLYAKESSASLQSLFETVYNDEKKSKIKEGMKMVQNYIELSAPAEKNAFNLLFSELSIIKFLREDRK
jgi:CRISPR/Cas system-associated protein Cas10 (large subunit of type III CRISPR-Cas system)